MRKQRTQTCEFNPRLDTYEHHFAKQEDGKWHCTRCGETREAGKPFALAGQSGWEIRTY